MSDNRSGFTIVELLVAVTILGTGLLALAAGMGSITRTLHGSRISTEAVQLATRRLDRLRAASRSTPTPCTSSTFSSSAVPITNAGVTTRWEVQPSGWLRVVRVIASYPVGGGRTRVDTLATTISCV